MRLDVSQDEVSERGQGLLKELAPADELAHRGEFAAADVDSGRVFFGKTALEALDAARTALPHARIYVGRVGARATYEFGPGSAPRHG